MLRNKKILLGVSGSIAAYKSATLIRLLIKSAAEVKVVMTPSAADFISKLTLSTLSKNPVYSDFIKDDHGQWNNHVDLGMWADLMIIAPASANTIAKIAHGFCDNLLTAVYLSAKCPVWIAPAMDLDMYKHPAVVDNLNRLTSFGHRIIDAEFGELASGLVGTGRMAEPETIVEKVQKFFINNGKFQGKKVLITAGPTYEAIDPVRFIGNHSSGKMGYEIARIMSEMGAEVTLVSGPTSIVPPDTKLFVRVQSAQEMFEQATKYFSDCEIIILTASVADYTPLNVSETKIKKQASDLEIKLRNTIDIAATLGQQKKKSQIMVGFALETDHEEAHAKAKLASKNLDMIVLNSLNDKGAGFAYDTNKITIITKDNKIMPFELKSKREVAQDIANAVLEIL